jgi:hypothetical protein
MAFEDTRDAFSWDQGRQWSRGTHGDEPHDADWWLPFQLEAVSTFLVDRWPAGCQSKWRNAVEDTENGIDDQRPRC